MTSKAEHFYPSWLVASLTPAVLQGFPSSIFKLLKVV